MDVISKASEDRRFDMDTEEVMLKFPQFFRGGEDLIDVVCDEEPDLDPVEDVLDDVILFEVL